MRRIATIMATVLAIAGCATPSLAPTGPLAGDAAYCGYLAAQYDRYFWQSGAREGTQLQRVEGEALCQRGQIAQGIAELRQAFAAEGMAAPAPPARR